MKYAELCLVKPTAVSAGKNDRVILEEAPDGKTFFLKQGQVGVRVGRNKLRSQTKPIEAWDATMSMYLSRGYTPVPGKTAPAERRNVSVRFSSETSGYLPEKTKEAQELVDLLTALARKAVKEAFAENVLVDVPSKEQITKGEEILSYLTEHYKEISLQEFNKVLCTYFATIPRRMKLLGDFLAHGKDRHGRPLLEEEKILEKAKIVAFEKDRLDILKSLISGKPEITGLAQTITEANGIEIRGVTDDERRWICNMLKDNRNKFYRAWRIVNKKTEKNFRKFCEKELLEENKGIDHLFHGSRGENFWSIITNGLTINPLNVVITGKAYGQGTYFAPDAVKSLGYTDRNGSKWANGNSSTGFLGIYKVATGKRYNGSQGCDSSLNWHKLQQICPGAHCTWAEHRYSGFMMDEVIVYQDNQSTIEYLVEVKA